MALFVGSAEAEADFCQTGKVRNYEQPLKRLPSVPAPPFDDRLDFAPARTFIGGFAPGPLQLGPAQRGFVLSFSPYEEHPRPSRRLDWLITASLVRLDRSGEQVGKPRQIEKHVKRLRPSGENYRGLDFSFDVPGQPALYRIEMNFENSGGKRLARFGENFRVLKPTLDVDFYLSGTTFRRGERVQAWLVNRGAAYLSFGLDKTVEYWDGTSWVPPPEKFPGGIVPAIGLSLGPGERASCWSTTIPANAVLGTYRFAKTVSHYSGPRFGSGSQLDLSAEFTVTE